MLSFYCVVLYLCVTTVAHGVVCVYWVRCVTVFRFWSSINAVRGRAVLYEARTA